MIVGLGIDLVEIDRIRRIHKEHPQRFSNRILTEAERAYVFRHRDPSERLAGRWAAKEAAFKALGTGLSQGLSWQNIEVLPNEWGKPIITFTGKAHEIVEQLGANNLLITITHTQQQAMAQVILERV